MTVRDKFRVNDRVSRSVYGVQRGLRVKWGTVVGFGRWGDIVRVRADGRHVPYSYHMDYWDVAEPKRVEVEE